ncbi:cation:proton antiporter [Actinoplanes sp. NPDC049316]|uniref:cation:proton antiporter domain-containing protein n=1 Tax=Actinoplanes sp. NPDC049316 TaxID=3154727 RepID=UPI0034135071
MTARWEVVPPLLLALVVIVVVARAFGLLARRLGQPAVIGEILGGILLGPTLFGGALTRAVFPAEIRPTLATVANVGVVLFMFLVGRELDRDLLRGQGRIAASVSLSAIALPFALGAVLAWYLLGNHPAGNRLAFVLFLGTAMSITAFPVLARILTDKGLLRTPIGGLALACASVDDVLAWTLLAVVAALAGAGSVPWQVLLVVPFALVLLLAVRPLLARAARRVTRAGRAVRIAGPLAVGAGLWASAYATELMGLHLIFGAFLFGAVVPRGDGPLLSERVVTWMRTACAVLLLPVFFVVAGIKVNLSSLDGRLIGELALILLVAIGGKCVGAYTGARLNGIRARHSAVLAILMNTRGLTELIVLTVGLQLGVLDTGMYSLMVVMALVTTAMAGILLPFVYPERLVRRDREPRLPAASPEAVP